MHDYGVQVYWWERESEKGAAAAYNIEYNILKDLVCGRKLGSQLVFMFIILRFCRTMTQTIRPL